MITIESLKAHHGENVLRHVRLGNTGSVLLTWDTNTRDSMGKSILGYAFATSDTDLPVFVGADFACSPLHAIDSDDCLRGLLGFLTLRPGDTDADYFENYTDAQQDYAYTRAEEDSMWAMDDGPGFIDVA